MPDIIHDDIFDTGLSQLTTVVENLYICDTQPTTFAEASSTYKLGTKASPTITGPTDGGAGGGRQVTVSAISDGVVDSAGTAAWFALTDDSLSKLLVSGNLASSLAIATGSPFTLTAFNIQIPDPTT